MTKQFNSDQNEYIAHAERARLSLSDQLDGEPVKLRRGSIPVETVIDKAKQLVDTSRQAVYGPPKDNMTDIGKLWGVLLKTGDIPPRTVALMMALLKISREVHTAKRDNLVDGIGYLYVADIVSKEEHGKE